MKNRRNFFKKLLGAGSLLSFQALSQQAIAEDVIDGINSLHQLDMTEAVQNEELWKRVQAAFSCSKSYLNLNNGGVSPQPTVVLNALQKYQELTNELPSSYLWRGLVPNRPILRQKLAEIGGCLPEEVAIMQNTTEAITTIILGMDWNEGDEVILSNQDYSTTKIGWEQLALRRKVKLVWVNIPSPIENDAEIVEIYVSKFTKKTRLIHLTHVINWTGQILPVEALAEICQKARKQKIFSLVDGAHSFAQLNFKIKDLQCDAYAASLHKWLCAPIGTGMLYLRQNQIPTIWSMFPSTKDQESKIEKFEHKGTISLAREEATNTAIEFHNHIGIELKEARLRYLKNYWATPFKDHERIQFYTSFQDRYSGAIALFDVKDADYRDFSGQLDQKFRIHHTNSETEGAQGIRISPNIYTSTADLDRLVEGLTFLLKKS